MTELTIYHNPKCSKSRKTLELIKNKKLNPKIVFYLEEKLSQSEIKNLISKLQISPRDLLRKGEDVYRENNLDDQDLSEGAIIDYMVRFPKLIERPIVVKGEKAIIGRPPENVLDLL